MKKILSLTLGVILMVPQPIHAMSESPVTDAIYTILKGGGQTVLYLGQGLWTVTSGVGSIAGDLAGRAASDLGMNQAVQGAATGVKNSAVSAATRVANTTLKVGVSTAAIVGAAYGTYWLYSAKTRQDLKDIKVMLEPTNPAKLLGQGNLICHWNIKNYPTAGDLASIGHDGGKVNNFLIQLAEGFINHKFRNGRPAELQGVTGWGLVHAARRILFQQIQEEKAVIEHTVRSLRGEYTLHDCEHRLNVLLGKEENQARPQGVVFDAKTKRFNYIGAEGYPLKRWLGLTALIGLEGNNFSFDYADELKAACIKAGTPENMALAPAELTPQQYKLVDDYMMDCAKTSNNKIKFIRGNTHYAQAARLYWNTYKKYHRLQVIEALLNNVEHQLPMQHQPGWNPNIVYHFGF